MPYLEANQPKFHDLESGDGPVALFVHGGPFDATMSSKQLDGPAAAVVATDVVESLGRAPISDRSSRQKWSHFPALAASQRAARAPAQRILFFTKSHIASHPLRLRFPALAASQRAARATAPQMAFADTDRIFLRSL
ncbi:MAG: hypothetical protein O6705_00160 [Actinobacteria bacterium]|nr:hypothetical protein [Actinomycetota bacterium]